MDSVALTPGFDKRSVRASILGAYWAVILLALPLWWCTTSIERLSLPISSVYSPSRVPLRFPVNVVLDNIHFTRDAAVTVQDLLRDKIQHEPYRVDGVAPYVTSGYAAFSMSIPAILRLGDKHCNLIGLLCYSRDSIDILRSQRTRARFGEQWVTYP